MARFKNKHKFSILVAVVVLLMSLVPMTVLANHLSGDTGNVSATVTPGGIAVTVTGQQLDYATLDINTTNNKPTGQIDQTLPPLPEGPDGGRGLPQ